MKSLFTVTFATALTVALLFSLSPRALADKAALDEATKAHQDAEKAVKTAQHDITTQKQRVKDEFAKTPEYVEAQAAFDKAKAAYDAAAKPVLDKVHASAPYMTAQKKANDADAKLTALKAGGTGSSDPKARSDAITAKSDGTKVMEKLENDALEADAETKKAKTALRAAQSKLDQLNKQAEELTVSDQGCVDARKALEDAKANVKTSKEALDEARKRYQEEMKNKRSGGKGKGGSGAGGAGAK